MSVQVGKHVRPTLETLRGQPLYTREYIYIFVCVCVCVTADIRPLCPTLTHTHTLLCFSGARGQGGQWIILEEASHSNPENFKLNIVPMMQIAYTTLMGISTAEGERNFYTQLMNMKKLDGSSLFRVLDTGLVCQLCIDNNVAADCTHKTKNVSGWKSLNRMAVFRKVMEGDKAMYAREVLGASVTGDTFAFPMKAVDNAFELPSIHLDSPVMHVCLAIDPSGGGSASDYSICTMVFQDDGTCVVHAISLFLYLYLLLYPPSLIVRVSAKTEWMHTEYSSSNPLSDLLLSPYTYSRRPYTLDP